MKILKFGVKYSFVLCIFLNILSCNTDDNTAAKGDSKSANGPASISIKVEGINSGTALLIASFADQNFKIDTATILEQGHFNFQEDSGYPQGAYYVMLPNNKYFQIILSDKQKFSLKTQLADPTATMEVTGNIDNELLYENLKYEREIQPQISNLAQQLKGLTPSSPQYTPLKKKEKELVAKRKNHLAKLFARSPNSLFESFKSAGQNPDLKEYYNSDGTFDFDAQVIQYRKEFWDNVDFTDERLIRTPVIYNKLKRYIKELTVQQPDSIKIATKHLMDQVPLNSEFYKFFANWIALQYEPTKTTLMDSEAIYVDMVQNYITYEKAYWADSAQVFGLQQRAYEMAASLIGLKGPNVTANDPHGNSQSIDDITSPYVIVYLYNPTCDHCIEQTPKLVKFYNQWKSKGVEVFAIAIDTDDESWKKFINKNSMNWINVYDPSNKSIYAKYYVDKTPEIYVLNQERIIIGKNLKVEQIETILNKDKNLR
ncbi:MAG: thioredoxin-like domain-containing protein [Saprospiraceae bacterium]